MTGACSFRKLCKTKGVQSQIYKTCSQRKDSGHIKTLFNLDLPLSIMYIIHYMGHLLLRGHPLEFFVLFICSGHLE